MNISIIGGTGNMGFGLGLRLAMAGHRIIVGSRHAENAVQAAERARSLTGCDSFIGMENREAVEAGELIIIAVPSSGHADTVDRLRACLADKPILDITVPLAFKPLRYAPPEAGSNALETAARLGEGCLVASGLHTISAVLLEDISRELEGDTLITCNDKGLKTLVGELCSQIGLTAYDAGTLTFSPVIESLTPMLIGMNKRYGSDHIGIRLAGVPR